MEAVISTLPSISLYAPDFVGFILPPIIQIINKDVTNESHRFIVTLITCMLVALITKYNYLQAGDVNALVTSFGIVFAESQIVYKLYFKNSALREVMDKRITSNGNPVG